MFDSLVHIDIVAYMYQNVVPFAVKIVWARLWLAIVLCTKYGISRNERSKGKAN